MSTNNAQLMSTSRVVQQGVVDPTAIKTSKQKSYWSSAENHAAWKEGDFILTLRESEGAQMEGQNVPKVFSSISGLGHKLYEQGVTEKEAVEVLRASYIPLGIALYEFVPREGNNNGSNTGNNMVSFATQGGIFKTMNTGSAEITAGDYVQLSFPDTSVVSASDTIGRRTKDNNPPSDEYHLVTSSYSPIDTYMSLGNIARMCLRSHDVYTGYMKQSNVSRDNTSNVRNIFSGAVGLGLMFLNVLLKNGVVSLDDNKIDDITDRGAYDRLLRRGDNNEIADRTTGLIARMLGLVGTVQNDNSMLPLAQQTMPDSDQTDEGELITKMFFRSVFADPTDNEAFMGSSHNGSLKFNNSGIFVNTDTELGQLHDLQLNATSNMFLSLLQFDQHLKSWVVGMATTTAKPGEKFGLLLSKAHL